MQPTSQRKQEQVCDDANGNLQVKCPKVNRLAIASRAEQLCRKHQNGDLRKQGKPTDSDTCQRQLGCLGAELKQPRVKHMRPLCKQRAYRAKQGKRNQQRSRKRNHQRGLGTHEHRLLLLRLFCSSIICKRCLELLG